MGDIDPLKPGVGLYLQDRDGGNRRQLNSEAVGILSLSWSADGNRIGFSMVHLTEPVDSAKLYVVNAKDPGEPKQLTSGIRFVWLDAGRFVATKTQTKDGTVTTHDEIMEIDETLPPKRLDDSVSIVRAISGNLVLLQDRHQTRQGLWTVSSEYLENPSKVNPKKMMIPEGALKVASSRFLYFLDPQNQLWKIDYATGRRQQVHGSFPGLNFAMSSQVSQGVYFSTPEWTFASAVAVDDGGSELAFVAYRYSAKLVMIENIFK
jgi:hypothetical protein